MTIARTPFDTTACRGYVMDRTTSEIARAMAQGWLTYPAQDIIGVQQGQDSLDSLPAFAHPIVLQSSERRVGGDVKVQVAVDLRYFGRWDRLNYKFIPTNHLEYNLNLLRGRLCKQWVDDLIDNSDKPTYQRDISPVLMSVYSSWLSENISARFALQPAEQYRLQILAGVFYYTLFSNDAVLEEQDKLKFSAVVSRNLKVSQPDVLSVIDAIGEDWLLSIDDFCSVASRVTGSVRLQELTRALVFAIVGGSWFGTNAKEWLHVALEHPPTWITLVYAVATERGYKNSGLGRIVDRTGNRRMADEFIPALLRLINDRVPLTAPQGL